MPSTPIYALPYPAASDPADVPLDLQELAERVETVLPTVPGLRLIEDKLLAAPAASFDFTSIPATFRSLQMILYARADAAAAVVQATMQFNGDAAGNYDTQQIAGSAAAASAAEAFAVGNLEVGLIPAASAPAGSAGMVEILVPGYAGTVFQKVARMTMGEKGTSSSGGIVVRHYHGFWRSTAAINRVRIAAGSGNFVVGSRATLYGWN